MNVTGVNGQVQGILPMNSKGQDRYEMSIQKQIVVLQEKMKNIGSDKEKPIEQKMSEKFAGQITHCQIRRRKSQFTGKD